MAKYVRVKFPAVHRLYTYRDPFGLKVGDKVLVPDYLRMTREATVVKLGRGFYLGRTKTIVKRIDPKWVKETVVTEYPPGDPVTFFDAEGKPLITIQIVSSHSIQTILKKE